jgi:hypothetical protein
MKSGNLNFLEPSGPLQACNGTVFFIVRIIKSGGDEMGRRIERRGWKNKYGILVRKPKGKRNRLEDVEWISLAQVRNKWRALVKTCSTDYLVG